MFWTITLLTSRRGVGTQAGDPREAEGIGAVFAGDRTEPLYVGSIKTNIGHLEGASGLAGVIKAMLCVEKGQILPNMHFNTPNPAIDFERLKIQVPQEVLDWNPENGLRRASVNSFGFGGSNAHLVLENYPYSCQAPARTLQLTPPISGTTSPLPSRPFLLPLTSHSENGGKLLQQSIANYVDAFRRTNVRDLASSYSTRRTLHQFRAYAIGRNLKEIEAATASIGGPEAKWRRASAAPRLGFVFTGQGAQWYAMGRSLITESTFFGQVLSECETILATLPDAPVWSLIDELTKSEADSRLSQSEFSQPLCTALQIALVDLLKTWSVEPSVVVGHSSGEIAAAYAAGILSRRDAIICAFYRGLHMSKGKDGLRGSMMAVGLTEAEAMIELEPYAGRAVIAAINSPSSITLSGDQDAILEIKKQLESRKVFARLLQVEQAFHSHHMQPLAPGFERAIASTEGFSPRPARIRMFSSVTGRDSSARPMDGTYWSSNMTEKVRFSDAIIGMVLDDNEERAVDILVEIGPHAALRGPSKQSMQSVGLDIPYVASLNRKLGAYESMLVCAGELFALGYQVNINAVNSDYTFSADGDMQCLISGKRLDNIPTYSWDHKKYWAETRRSKEYRQRSQRHSLLGALVPGSPANHPRWQNYLRNSELTWMAAHAIDGKTILPAAAYFALAVEAVTQIVPVLQIQGLILSDVSITTALVIPDSDTGVEIIFELQLIEDLTSISGISYRFTVYSFTEDGETVRHCYGTISTTTSEAIERHSDSTFAGLQSRTLLSRSANTFYERLFQIGLQYGDEFRLVSGDVEAAPEFAIANLTYKPSKIVGHETDACIVHPTLLDSAFHVIFAALEMKLGYPLGDAYVPTFCRSLRISAAMIARKHDISDQDYWLFAETNIISPRLNSNDVTLHQNDSNVRLVEIQGLELTALGISAGNKEPQPLFFRVRWKEAFNCLGINAAEPEFHDLASLLACYTHQYPENKILNTSSESPVPEGALFDLVIVEKEDFLGSIAKLLKPNGFVIGTIPQFTPDALYRRLSQGNLTIWQAAATGTPHWPEELTLFIGSSPSARTTELALAIQLASPGKVSIMTLDNLSVDFATLNDFISLVGLDEDIFSISSPQDSAKFVALKNILCTPNKNIVWLQKASTGESDDALYQSLFSGLARTARIENESLRLVTLELPLDFAAQDSCRWIDSMLDPSLQDDEFIVKDGCLMIPRIEIDEDLNGRRLVRDNGQTEASSFRDNPLQLAASLSSRSTDELVPVQRSIKEPTLFSAEKTYLIVGGLGGLCRLLAPWMFRKGARKFAFLSRSGATKADAIKTVRWLEKRGAIVCITLGSVTDKAAVHQWVRSIEGDLGGVFQGAMVLQSGPLSKMTANAWQTVLDPKVKGSYNLHFATLDRPLDFFLCFSSILAIIGFMSEANYAAANGFMDSFMAWRRKQGLPGTSMNIVSPLFGILLSPSDCLAILTLISLFRE